MKKYLLILCIPLLYGCNKEENDPDATKVSPNNYVTILEVDRVRVIKENLKPGEATDWHSSPATVSYFISDNAEIREHFPNDRTLDKKDSQRDHQIQRESEQTQVLKHWK